VYYVIDCALPTSSGVPQSSANASGGGTTVPAGEAGAESIPIAVVSTPNQAGDVIHEVQSGQTLWQIAIAYSVKVDEIKAFNNLVDNNIYPGETLLIKKVAPAPTETATLAAIETAAPAPTASATSTHLPPAVTALPGPATATSNSNLTIMAIAIGIIALALLGGGIVARLGGHRER
jgi:LysM repeat protein